MVKCFRMRPTTLLIAAASLLVGFSAETIIGQRGGVFRASRDHPAILYSSGPANNAISRLNRSLRDGTVELEFDEVSGYLRSVLKVLEIPAESQVTVFSQTSFQAELLGMDNPRAIYFADEVAVAFVRGGSLLEVAAQDQQRGTIFYTLEQTPVEKPQFGRNDGCLACHLSWDTLGVPGLQILTTFPMSSDPNAYATGFASDHRSRIEDRWGGWYVTGRHERFAHMGNIPVTDVDNPEATIGIRRPALASLEGQFDLEGYLSASSDIAALMVLEHQTHMVNLLTRIGWEARRIQYRNVTTLAAGGRVVDDGNQTLQEVAVELVDYLLFIDEAPLPTGLESASGFAERFMERGPVDSEGRSLREFDLSDRLFRYPCSYMIYTDMFNALPAMAKDVIYRRLWQVLSGDDQDDIYARLSVGDREAIVEILRETKPDLPRYFHPVSR